ncbi:ABC transporter substrate-binding protein [Streptomyces radicis]|uniref:ABC transporter substrate-binding protein n=1 Tax=Streptomyces radicis TaxID=1750517 RepID=A0A3A9WKX6_9ACTN|nr:ABC transporter substrate-binding protein [Streptomyces radicis]RKN27833.1 ABC transporter substrate-binding protein [Streptomyces radicis]
MSAALTLAACGTFDGGTASSSDGDEQTLTVSLQFTPRANYALETDDALVLTQVGCLETLLTYDDEAGALRPALATEWRQTAPTVWEFTLRDGVTFQDGTDLTADAVARSLRHVLDADTPPRAFTPESVSAVEAVDDATLSITTPEPSALLPYRLASGNTGILARAAYGDQGIDPIGHCTGPFTPVSQVAGQSISLERNEDYWGEPAEIAHVEARFIAEGATRATQVQTGESQIALGVPVTSLADLRDDDDVEVTEEFTPRTTGLYFNLARAPFDDLAARRAVQAALDLDAMASGVYAGGAQPAVGPFAPGELWAPEDAVAPTRDPAAAERLLAEAGYEPGELSLTLLAYTERPEFADLAAVVQADLEAIGIDVEVRSSNYSAIEPSLLEGDFDFALLSRNHLTDIADPLGYLTSDYSCAGSYNISQHCDQDIDELLSSANTMDAPEDRATVYGDVARHLQDEAITAFIVHEQTYAAHRTSVSGFVDDPLARYAVTADVTLGRS